MTRICLVRHGQTDWNYQGIIQGREDIPLNENGKRQALDSGLYLAQENWNVIVSSPLTRAYETAEIIAQKVGIQDIEIDERFIERDFGEASGKYIIDARHLVTLNEVDGLETEEEIQNRGLQGLHELVKKHKGKSIIVVAHSHTIKGILSGINCEQFHFSMTLENACANYVCYNDKKFHIEKVNVSDHISI